MNNINIIIQDDFENYSSGSFPYEGGWKAYFNAVDDPNHNAVTDSTAYSGSKSLQVYGSHSGCWAALVTHDLPKKDVIYIEAAMKASGEAGGGCHKNDIQLGLGWKIISWGHYWKSLVSFRSDRKIYGVGGVLQDFTPNKWYKIKIKLDLTKGVVTYWIDGNLIATRSVDPFDYSYLAIESGDGKGWIDDIRIYEIQAIKLIAAFINTPKTPIISQTVTFDASPSYSPSKILSYECDFGDGSKAKGKIVSHRYDKLGKIHRRKIHRKAKDNGRKRVYSNQKRNYNGSKFFETRNNKCPAEDQWNYLKGV